VNDYSSMSSYSQDAALTSPGEGGHHTAEVHLRDLEGVAERYILRQRQRAWIASYATPSAAVLHATSWHGRAVRVLLNAQTSRPVHGARYWHGTEAMHHKLIIGDDTVLTGSYNFSGPGRHDLLVTLTGDITEFVSLFERLWKAASTEHAAYTRDDLRLLLDAVVKVQRRWTPFTSSLSRTLSAGTLSQGQIRALLNAYRSGYGRPFEATP
jgi:hypothetical protein